MQIPTQRVRRTLASNGILGTRRRLATAAAGCLALAISVHGQQKSASAPPPSVPERQVAAYVAGQPIYSDDIDRMVHAQLRDLQWQAYAVRKSTLENEINRVVIEKLAKDKGVSTAALRRQLTESRPPADEEVDNVYGKNKARFGTVSEQEAKDQIRQVLQQELQKRAYRDNLQKARDGAEVRILLSGPMASTPEFLALTGPTIGTVRPDAVRVVIFGDYQCPYCRSAEQPLTELLTRYADKVQLIYKHFPLDNHAQAFKAAEASLCADQQGAFAQYHALLFSETKDLSVANLKKLAERLSMDADRFATCVDSGQMASRVNHDKQQGEQLGVRATPTIIVDGEILRGLPAAAELNNAIDRAVGRRQSGRLASR